MLDDVNDRNYLGLTSARCWQPYISQYIGRLILSRLHDWSRPENNGYREVRGSNLPSSHCAEVKYLSLSPSLVVEQPLVDRSGQVRSGGHSNSDRPERGEREESVLMFVLGWAS